MISRDKNRAAVILWSVANEIPRSEERLKFISALAERVHSLDTTRLVTAALETHYVDPHTILADDSVGKYVDVASCNEYIGWYDGLPDKIDGIAWKTAYDKPFIISEFGADAVWTEEFQANVYRRQIAMFRRIPFLSGTIAWVLVDFRSPRLRWRLFSTRTAASRRPRSTCCAITIDRLRADSDDLHPRSNCWRSSPGYKDLNSG